MSLKYVVEVFKLASKEVLGDYLSLEKFIELEKHLKSKTLNSEDTINLLNPQDIEFFIKVSKRLSLAVMTCERALVCYQSPDSPSRRPLDPELLTPYAQYVLYGKKLE